MKVTFPGLIDLQVNGFAGVDFNNPHCQPDQIKKAMDAMRATGVTNCLPTLITSSLECFAACAKTVLACHDPAVSGIHMEGPYISPVDGTRGAHPAAHVIPASIEDFKSRQDAAEGNITLVTLAPEVGGAIKLIEYLVAQKVRVALGHTAAAREHIRDAISAGATFSTHLGNGCAQTLHRHNNVIWEQLAADELSAGIIVDGHHLPPAVVKSIIRAKGLARTVLVTDAISAAAAPPARYFIGELEVEVDANGRVSQPGAQNLAGSSLTMNAAVANTVRFSELSFDDILPLATTQPARYMGIEPSGQVTADWDPVNYRLNILETVTNKNQGTR
ncbi:MAG: amidohydrolase family protein [Kiritimatiellae bacterium]|nr:amidohydrolase family protein [Kiritimatiellia bacterium]MDD5519966.1 amidohydrolase family protein [Kiritimatiellia bacterium]